MGTIRVARRARYTSIDRRTIRDTRLSFRARGVLLWLLDRPDESTTDSDLIAEHGAEGRDAIRTALRELRDHGYMTRRKVRGERGRWVTESWVFERPQPVDNPPTDDGKPGVGGPALVVRLSEDQALLETPTDVGDSKEREKASLAPDADFAPTIEHQELAAASGVVLPAERSKWIAWCSATGATFADLDAAFTLWLHRARSYDPGRASPARAERHLELVTPPASPWSCSVGNPLCAGGHVLDPEARPGTPVERCECLGARL